jgi:hypothetical protein
MTMPHFTLQDFWQFVDRCQDEIHNRLLLHHLEVCPECYETAGFILDRYRAGDIPLAFVTTDLYIAQSRVEAPLRFAELSGLSAPDRKARIQASDRYRSWGFAEWLSRRSLAEKNPVEALCLAELAVLVAMELRDGEPVEAGWIANLRAYTFAHLGHLRLGLGDSLAAHEAFERAREWQEEGRATGNDLFGYDEAIAGLMPRECAEDE